MRLKREDEKKLRKLTVEEQADIKNPIIEKRTMWGYQDPTPHEASKNIRASM